MQAMMSERCWVRPGVRVFPTTISEDPDGRGAFAPTLGVTRRCSFLGVYRARHWRRASDDHPYRGVNDYTMQIGGWRAACQAPVQLSDYKMLAVQEPPHGVTANAAFLFFSKAGDIGADLPASHGVALVALYAARDLDPGEEILVHYGPDKHRDYPVGIPAKICKYEIPKSEYPSQFVHGNAVADGWRPR